MVSFQRMKDELDGLGTTISSRVPVVGKTGCFMLTAVGILVFFIVAFAIGYSSHKASQNGKTAPLISTQTGPNYVFVSNTSGSCPALAGQRLLTTMKYGDSFEGLIVNLACRGDYNVFPNQVKCRRKSDTDPTLEWSHLPVCYPSVLVSKTHWTKALHVRSVSCTGDSIKTGCSLSCIRDYVAVEADPYSCTRSPCPHWTLGNNDSFIAFFICLFCINLANFPANFW